MYNNFLYALAARVGEKLAGQTWEQLVQTMLLDVIGMKETSFINETNIDVATPYMSARGELTNIDLDVHRFFVKYFKLLLSDSIWPFAENCELKFDT